MREKADELLALFTSTDWVFSNDHRARPGTEVKIAEGVFVIERTVKVRGGLIRASAVNRESRLSDVHLSGDFFFYPAARLIDLERALEGIRAQPEAIAETVRRFYQTNGIESPGVEAPDFAGALAGPA